MTDFLKHLFHFMAYKYLLIAMCSYNINQLHLNSLFLMYMPHKQNTLSLYPLFFYLTFTSWLELFFKAPRLL